MAACLSAGVVSAANYADDSGATAFIDQMVKDYGFSEDELKGWLSQAEKKQSILDAISRPAEKTKTWAEYRKIFVTSSRVSKGVDFWQENSEALTKAETTYGVPAEIIVAIIGVETRYGQYMGSYRVIDALSTLAFDYPPRSPFFTKELREFLILTREQNRDPLSLKGSYAGAMGFGQFMPSSYRAYAADFDDDGFIDIWENRKDAIGSVANYFVRHGWKKDEPVVVRARTRAGYDKSVLNDSLKPLHTVASLEEKGFTPVTSLPGKDKATAIELEGEHGTEFWMGLNNFYVITRYNHSRLYAMAVYQLSQEILQAKGDR
ncbi:lytic murein transglycosylase B [Pseudomaricurvus sp.]|uniref:lytic murein transglycosylase B n=1 Tax=Pseudomaricurvus sp. TaxID=2004510 RepID=UPI003F6B431E